MRTKTCVFLVLSFLFQHTVAQQAKPSLPLVEKAAAGKYRLVDRLSKQPLNNTLWDSIRPFANGLAAVQRTGKWGFVNHTGEETVPALYDAVTDFRQNSAVVCVGDACNRINERGQPLPVRLTSGRKNDLPVAKKNPVHQAAPTNYLRTTSALPCPPNIDFEAGNFTNWQTNTGTTSAIGTTNFVNLPAGTWQSAGLAGRHSLQDKNTITPSTDLYGAFPVNPLNGGRYSLKLGSDADQGTCGNTVCPGSLAEGVRYVVNVPANATDYSITFSYAVVLENPLDGINLHKDHEQPRFTVKMYDPLTAEVIPCANFNFVASGPLPGFDTSDVIKRPDAVVRFKDWSSVYVNLSKYAGKTFYLEFTTADCTRGGHFGYAYVDVMECGIAARSQTRCGTPNVTTLYGPPGFQGYQWFTSNFSSLVGTAQNVTLNPGPAYGSQYWVVTTPYPNTGCPTCDCRDTVRVVVEPNYPDLDAGPDKNLCPGTTATIGPAALTGYGYQWTPSAGLANAGAASTVVTATTSTQYVLTVTDTLGCTATDTVQVALLPKPVVAFAPDKPAQCLAGNRFVFSNASSIASGTLSYQWNFGDGATSAQKSPSHSYAAAGTYDVVLTTTGSNGCVDSARQTITVHPTPVLTLAGGGNFTICRGGSASLHVSGAVDYLWTPAVDLSCTACAAPVASPLATALYFVEGTNSVGCRQKDSARVTVIQPFKINSVNDTLCLGDSVLLSASGALNYSWSPATGLSSTTIARPKASPQTTTTYTVVGHDNNNCFTDTAYAVVTVAALPTVSLGPDLTLATGSTVTLANTVTNGPITTWLWAPRTALNCYTCPTPVADVKTDVTYRVVVTNNFGCTAADTLAIKAFCAEGQVFIPNAFTPDGDAINDVFFVQGRGITLVKSLRIFNRWGELLFEKKNVAPNDVRQGWDGKIRGVTGPPDVFVYTAEVQCTNGSLFFFKGNVSIIK